VCVCLQVVHDYTVEHGAYPSPLRYHHFPKSVCTSVNEVICHGIPDMRELQSGDIVNVDVSCMLNGAHGDLNETYVVGKVDDDSKKLIKVRFIKVRTTCDCMCHVLPKSHLFVPKLKTKELPGGRLLLHLLQFQTVPS
jgi:hypothetical protein